MYSGKQIRHTTKLFKNTSLKNCLLRPATLEKASKKRQKLNCVWELGFARGNAQIVGCSVKDK